MPWVDWMQWLVPLLSMVLGGTGLWTLLASRATARATRDAADATAAAANQAATTADWSGLMAYWQAEMSALRTGGAQLEVRVLFLERQREDDLAHIDALEAHIWAELPPPPPLRRRRHGAGEGS